MKTHLNSIKKIFILFSFFYFLNAAAQAPNKISYQAVVRNAAGALVANTNVGIQISILQTTATGAPVYLERHTTTSNANGLATLEIGGGAPVAGVFANINWANGPYFIKTETDPTGGTNYTISGTSQMLSVPYALFAGASANTWGLNGNAATATSFIGTTNNVDIFFKRNGLFAGVIEIDNVSIGVGALQLNTSGLNNTAFGTNALSSNTTGSRNVAFGINALGANTTGASNVAFGSSALDANTTGTANLAFGSSALGANTTGDLNVAIGLNSLQRNTTGFDNTAIGTLSLNSNTTGMENTAIGKSALRFNTTGFENTAVGKSALQDNITGISNTAVGHEALSKNTGSSNTAVGTSALSNVAQGSGNTAIGSFAQVANATGSNQVRIGNTSVALASVHVAWTITSDNRWKSNIQKSNLGLEFIKQLNPVFYTRKDVQDNGGKPIIMGTTTNPTTEYGFIAQELESTLNKFNAKNNGIISKDDAGMLGVRYNDLLAPMVKAMQEQQVMIEELKLEIINLKKKL